MDELITDLLPDILKKLASVAVEEIKLLVGVDEEVENLQEKLAKVQAMLNKAEERQQTDEIVKIWYDELKDASYMVDDVVDSWNTAKIKLKIQEKEEKAEADSDSNASTPLMEKVCSFFPCLSCFHHVDNLPLRHDVGNKIKELNQTLDKILNDRQTLGIDFNTHTEVLEQSTTTTLDVDVSSIIGRDDYSNKLLESLLPGGVGSQEEERNLRVISLVGMGGIGKSTLAQLAYNHENVKSHFPIKMWVCVSKPFNECKVAKAIIQEVDSKHESLNKVTEFQTLLNEIRKLINKMKFFLVLDDVWEYKKWEPFQNALNCGAQGSRILVTTRNEDVARMMVTSAKTDIINLGKLSDDNCWLVISKIAFYDVDELQHKELEILEILGRQLASKCKGLPLAAKTLGSHMRGNLSRKKWEEVLHSKWWELEDIEKGTLAPLLLSYHELPPIEKQCFLYCAVFPKDYSFNRLELVIHWMAQGYINSKDDREIEAKGEKYFDNLAMRSFFQDFVKDESDGRIVSCKMHDIVHAFAQSMTKDVCFTIEGDEEVKIDFKRTRLLSLMVKETFPESVYEAKNLRFLNLDFMSSQIIQPKLFDHLTCLRTLHLEGKSILELPNEVEKLIHLRYLKLSCNNIEELPKSICNLCNLQSLDVSGCRKLEKLPQGIGKLINLRHLLIDGIRIKSFPKGIGRLTCLKTLGYFPVGKGEEICKLGELEHLNHIQGKLKIYGLSNVVDFGAIENTLKKKKDLRDLELIFNTLEESDSEFEEEEEETKKEEEEEETEEERRRKMEKDVAILNALEPPPRLESLRIGYYLGTTMYPNWMMSKLTYLKRLIIGGCPNLEQLPPLGKLPLLEELRIEGLWIEYNSMIRKVGDEFLGIDIEEEELSESSKDIIIFPNLKSLRFELTYLKRLFIGGCLNLEQLPPLGKLPLLEELQIVEAPMIRKVGDEFLGIDIEEEELSEDIIIFPNLKSLEFESLDEWEEWSGMGGTIEEEEEKDNSANAFVTNNTPKIQIMPLLHSLQIWNCGKLKSLPDYLRNTPLLQELYISGCPILKQRCERGRGDYWPNISHIPNIQTNFKTVNFQRALIQSNDSDSDDDSDEEAPEAANAEDSSIRTFTTARLDTANAGGGSGSARLGSQHEDQDGESELLLHG